MNQSRTRALLFIVLTSLLVSGCAFVPKESKSQPYAARCEMVTRDLDLKLEAFEASGCQGGSADLAACLLVYSVGVPVVSLAASGSIVLVGNTLHWLEFHGTCDQGFIANHVDSFNRAIGN